MKYKYMDLTQENLNNIVNDGISELSQHQGSGYSPHH